ncbi:helix-turn-helix domain-containing protein [Acinetobacter courvalinii]|uniref:helix-turn-helix domain-containing protein n=1 Tax=Acinetobacter courvalinii TaxID=280147 RepID=UPI0021CF800D|nr:helix-turn-helix domain-containing protein [Acinetobacter courvalinii]MCU4367549.1 Fis family transcriptional regulator [Acinetobacter courvalinii]MCU4445755.1 Fis family transcriptional regulator [Acinetobacter courvalinii]
MNTVPEKLKAMKPQARWEWFDRQKEILREAAKTGTKAEFAPELAEAFMYMSDIADLKYCERVTMHHNAIVVVASALIESDFDNARDWLLNLVEQADEVTWQMYSNAQEFYDRNQLNWPNTIEEHQENIAQSKVKAKEDSEKFDVWYEQNVNPLLKSGSPSHNVNFSILREDDIEQAIKEGKTKNLIEHLEDIITQKALVVTHGNMTRAAELICLNRSTLAKRNKRYLKKRTLSNSQQTAI